MRAAAGATPAYCPFPYFKAYCLCLYFKAYCPGRKAYCPGLTAHCPGLDCKDRWPKWREVVGEGEAVRGGATGDGALADVVE